MTSARRVGLFGATGIGVGSMLGAGVFSGMWAEVMAAGDWYLIALAIAGGIAAANALSTAQLAARHPVAGGAYAYGRAELGAFAGRLAGAAFVVGKTASVGVGALVLGLAVLPDHARLVATGAIILCWAQNARGITRTAAGATAIAVLVSAVLVGLIVAGALGPAITGEDSHASLVLLGAGAPSGGLAILTGAAAAFFAFAGYARIATLGEEVRSPERTIPRAIGLALAWVLALYLALAVVLRSILEPVPGTAVAPVASAERTVDVFAEAPLLALASATGVPVWVVAAAAALAVGGAMLAVMAGAGRTAMAMAREGDLPRGLAAQGASGAPWRAEAVIAIGALALVWSPGLNLLLVSVATILTYYAVANVAAIAQRRAGRTGALRVPMLVPVVGLGGSLLLGSIALAGSSATWWWAAAIAAFVVGWPTVLTARQSRRS